MTDIGHPRVFWNAASAKLLNPATPATRDALSFDFASEESA